MAPDPEGSEENPYYETITFTAIGDVTNAESQVLAVIHYRQIVQRKSNNKIFHDETGYWHWDEKNGVIMQSLTIPRGVCLLAGGSHNGEKESDGTTILNVSASLNGKDWKIIQSPFMESTAKTMSFEHRIQVGNGQLSYSELTVIDIYGKEFQHTDENELILISE